MAQLTAGILFQWGAAGADSAEPSSWTTIPDVTSIPTLIGAPSNHDVTTLYDTQKVYLEGLPDNGGQLAFAAWMTPELLAEVEKIQTAQDTDVPYFRVALPSPLAKAYIFRGTLAIPANDEWAPDAPIACSLNITPTTEVTLDEYTE